MTTDYMPDSEGGWGYETGETASDILNHDYYGGEYDPNTALFLTTDYNLLTTDYNQFANPGGNSALRASSRFNPRNLPCPTCDAPNRITPEDARLGYQCDDCADEAEGGWGY